jgi:hypothetical protein
MKTAAKVSNSLRDDDVPHFAAKGDEIVFRGSRCQVAEK